ncbi:hypothetical protein C8Q76DRAFT_746584 [Earliella scabrosa]|nr:hypothetical protein C8Q76DRAFT_746584 [Earliella scabrosa]
MEPMHPAHACSDVRTRNGAILSDLRVGSIDLGYTGHPSIPASGHRLTGAYASPRSSYSK